MLRRFTGIKCKIARLDHRSDIRSDQQRHPRTERSNLFFLGDPDERGYCFIYRLQSC